MRAATGDPQEEWNMCKYGWVAVGAVALFVQMRPVVAAEPMSTPQATVNPSGVPATGFCSSCSASYAAHGTCAACPKHGWLRKNNCDEGGGKLSRICNWLFYVPQKVGCAGVCCNGSIRPQVPFYAYFPSKPGSGTACTSCSTGHGVPSYAMANQSSSAPVMTGGEAQSNGATASPVRLSTY